MSNAHVAQVLGAPVFLVGKSGVGDAVDSYNLNACFFEARGVRVLGGVFNRISTEGFYSLERCREVGGWIGGWVGGRAGGWWLWIPFIKQAGRQPRPKSTVYINILLVWLRLCLYLSPPRNQRQYSAQIII